MKRFLVVPVLFGFVLAGCGSGDDVAGGSLCGVLTVAEVESVLGAPVESLALEQELVDRDRPNCHWETAEGELIAMTLLPAEGYEGAVEQFREGAVVNDLDGVDGVDAVEAWTAEPPDPPTREDLQRLGAAQLFIEFEGETGYLHVTSTVQGSAGALGELAGVIATRTLEGEERRGPS